MPAAMAQEFSLIHGLIKKKEADEMARQKRRMKK